MSTDYHAKFYSLALTRRSASNSLDKLGQSLLNATVDLNPHQIDAALFAFRSPLSRGAILADEVGLGKTIEAGLIISQLWAERRRKILAIVPTTLRKQWAQELAEKFYLPWEIFDARAYNAKRKAGLLRPLDEAPGVVICSYHFARAQQQFIREVDWDLVVIDEAHRLRNVYKSGNKIARSIKDAVQTRPKVLLTATPLQNSLFELFGLVGFLDEHLFGDMVSFRSQYLRGPLNGRQFDDLKRRIRPICQRTLRRQVTEYVRYTNRIPITRDFTPTEEEQRLYDQVSAYLRRASLHALPSSQRKLMTLVLRKLLASSSFAIAGTLRSLINRLDAKHTNASTESRPPEEDFEAFEEIGEEWSDYDAETGVSDEQQSTQELKEIEDEIRELTNFHDLATSITMNAKGEALLQALAQGLQKLESLGANRKAVIFTESRRTQEYLYNLLESHGYTGQVMTFNGTNTDASSAEIYQAWRARHAGGDLVTGSKAIDIRSALIEHFQTCAPIMVATEAAAEGVNLQFCSLVVNYDLPWNPQRIEQRIGRCHRYGQKHDVVVINFLNRSNEADLRVFQILSEKFRLFDGVFGASDEVLGAVESGVDFEKRIADIYQSCRTPAEIDAAFDALQRELEDQIEVRLASTRAMLLENFDEDVRARLRINYQEASAQLDRLGRWLWKLTRHELRTSARFDEDALRFDLASVPLGCEPVPTGSYQLSAGSAPRDGRHVYRPGHPLAEFLIGRAASRRLEPAKITFDYSTHRQTGKISLVEELLGRSGYLLLTRVSVQALEREDHLLFAGRTDSGEQLDGEVFEKLFNVDGRLIGSAQIPDEVSQKLDEQIGLSRTALLARVAERNSRFFEEEIEKLERWAEDLKDGLEQELKELDAEIKGLKKQAKLQVELESKLELHRKAKELEVERSRKRRTLFDAQDEIDRKKESLISEVEGRLQQRVETEPLFAIRWEVK